MKNIASTIALLLSVSILSADHHKEEESNLKLPTSWKEYISLKKSKKRSAYGCIREKLLACGKVSQKVSSIVIPALLR